jgi:DNA replication protein DnaC
VVDEAGFEAVDQQDASLFFRRVSDWSRRGRTAIATNLAVCDWPWILAADDALTEAILDGLSHPCVVNVRGRSSWRLVPERILK